MGGKYINIDNGRLRYAGITGGWWPSSAVAYTSVTSARAYYLGFSDNGVGPSNGPTYRWLGFPLRRLKCHP